jgi:hypothetical protein
MNVFMDKLETMTATVQNTSVASMKIPFLGMKTVKQDGKPIAGHLHTVLYSWIVNRNLSPSSMHNGQYHSYSLPSCMIDYATWDG